MSLQELKEQAYKLFVGDRSLTKAIALIGQVVGVKSFFWSEERFNWKCINCQSHLSRCQFPGILVALTKYLSKVRL